MTRPLNIRRTLLAAVDAFLEASPTSLTQAHRLIDRCYNYSARHSFTLDDVVWGGLISALTDSLFYEEPATLREYRSLLARGSHEVHRAYLNHNFDDYFTSEERLWHAMLNEMVDFLAGFPFADQASEWDVTLQEYKRRVEAIIHTMRLSPPPERLEDETIYHLILREVSAILTTVDLRYALLRSTHLVSLPTYTSFPPQPMAGRDDTPDISENLDWARRALKALVEQGWLLLAWQITPTHYHLSFH